MNPYKLKNVYDYLTSNNQLLKKKLKLGTSEIPIPPKKQNVLDIEVINRFNKAHPRVDTTSLKPLSVKHSNVKQSNAGQADEGVIQGAFDTATREAQSEGFPAPKYDAFKKRYLKRNMKADGGRMEYKDGEGVITIDDKIDEMISFYKDYLNQGGKMDFKTFSKKYIPENFADGGRTGYNIGSVPGEQGSMGPVYTTNKIEDAAKEVVKRLIKLDGVDIPLTDKISMSLGPELDQTEIRGVMDILGGELNFGGGMKGDEKGIGFTFRKQFQDGGRIGFFKGELVQQGPNTGKVAVRDLKLIKDKEGKITNRLTAYFDNMETANAAIQKHKEGESGKLKYKKSKKILNDPKLKTEFLKYSMGKDVTGKMIRKKYNLSNDEFFYGGLREIIDKDFLQYSKSQALKSNTIKNMLLLHNNKLSKDFIRNGLIVPDDIVAKLGLNISEAATATARLSQHYSGMDFGFKELKSIRRNNKAGSELFTTLNNFKFGNPYRSNLYKISLQLIDDQLGNEQGTFRSLKKKAAYILKKNKIKGFDINEIAGVTGTAKTGVGEFSQFIDVMDSNLNQKQMASFQAAFSVARQNILNNPNSFTTESKKINKLAGIFEREYGVKLPRIRALDDVEKYYSPKRLEELKNQGLDIKAASKKLGYTVQMPPGAMTINEFVDQSTPQAKKQLNMTLELIKQSNPEAAKKIQMTLNSGLPVDQIAAEIARIPGVKQFGRAFMKIGGPFEVAFAGMDIANEVSKGAPLDTAVQTGISNITLGALGNPEKYQMTDLTNAGSEIGVNTTGFQELKTILDLEKKITSRKRSLEDYKFLNEETGDMLGGTFDIEQQEKNIADLESQYKIQATKLRSSENFDTLFEDYNSAVEYLARKQYNKTLDSRKDRVYPDAGTMGSDFMTTIMNPIKSFLPQNLMETGLGPISNATRPYVRAAQKIPFIGSIFEPTSDAAKLSAMSQDEKDQRALDMNIVKQNYHPVMGTTMRPDQMEEYYANYFSKGGIASLTDTIPPESGPTPQGLPYVYNNVKKI